MGMIAQNSGRSGLHVRLREPARCKHGQLWWHLLMRLRHLRQAPSGSAAENSGHSASNSVA